MTQVGVKSIGARHADEISHRSPSPKLGEDDVVELDELFTFIKDKKTKVPQLLTAFVKLPILLDFDTPARTARIAQMTEGLALTLALWQADAPVT